MRTKMRRPRRVLRVAKNCPYCQNKSQPNYTDTAELSRYLTERGKILARTKTGICSTHQRALTKAIKRARHVALLPFVVRV